MVCLAALHLACEAGHVEVVKSLIEQHHFTSKISEVSSIMDFHVTMLVVSFFMLLMMMLMVVMVMVMMVMMVMMMLAFICSGLVG